MPEPRGAVRRLTVDELLPLALAASHVDNGLAPSGSTVGSCPSCGGAVTGGEGQERPATLDLAWAAQPCGCCFLISDETLDSIQRHLSSHRPEGDVPHV